MIDLASYLLGLLTIPAVAGTYVLLLWLFENKVRPNLPEIPFISKQKKTGQVAAQKPCKYCGSVGRHKKECPNNKEKSKADKVELS